MPPVSALIGLNATLPSSFTQISWRNRVVTGQRKPAAISASAMRLARSDLRAVRLAEADAIAFGVTDDAGLDDVGGEVGERSDHAPRLDRAGDDAARIDALEAQAVELAAVSWKYHHGMPFCVLTTTVSGPKSGGSGGASAVRRVRLDAEEHDVGRADRREIAGDLRP